MGRSKNIHIQHVRSSALVDNEPKLPTSGDIQYGEWAINFAQGHETISLRNSADEIVSFNIGKSIKAIDVNGVDATIVDHVASVTISGSDENVGEYETVEYPQEFSGAVNVSGEQTIAEAFNSVETTVSSLVQEVVDNELTTSKAIIALANAAGTTDDDDNIEYVAPTNAKYISGASSLYEADLLLDSALQNNQGAISSITVNGSEATIENKVASVVISGSDTNVGTYTSVEYPEEFTAATNVSGDQTISEAFNSVETTIAELAQVAIDSNDDILKLAQAAGTINDQNEIGYIEKPNANYISEATSLADADDLLDEALYSLSGEVNSLASSSITAITANGVDADVEDNVATFTLDGADIDVSDEYETVEYPEEFVNAEAIVSGDSIDEAFNKVETTISALTNVVIENEKITQEAVFALAEAAGTVDSNNNIQYVVNENANYISGATSLADADNILDSVLHNSITSLTEQINEVTASSITAITVNEIQASVADNVATIEIDGSDIKTSTDYQTITYPETFSGGRPIQSGDTFDDAFNKVETTISALTEEVLKNELVTSKAIKALGVAAGTIDENDNIQYVVNENAHYINVANSLADADNLLDDAIYSLANSIASSVTGMSVNGVDATVSNGKAVVNVEANDIDISSGYTSISYPSVLSAATPIASGDSTEDSFNKVETAISALTEQMLAVANAAGTVDTNNNIGYVADSNAHYISAATSLVNADSLLDAALYEANSAITALSSSTLTGVSVNGIAATVANNVASVTISGSDANVGTYTSVAFPQELSGAVNVSGDQTIAEAFNAVETTVSALTKEVIDNEETTTKAFINMATAIGNVTDPITGQIEYIPNLTDPIVSGATSYNDAILLLSEAIQDLMAYHQ